MKGVDGKARLEEEGETAMIKRNIEIQMRKVRKDAASIYIS